MQQQDVKCIKEMVEREEERRRQDGRQVEHRWQHGHVEARPFDHSRRRARTRQMVCNHEDKVEGKIGDVASETAK